MADMPEILQNIKSRPIATLTIGGILAIISAVISGWIAFDARYVLAAEYRKDNTQQVVQMNNIQKARVKDELFKLEQILPEKRKGSDNALILRFKRNLDDINRANSEGKPVAVD